MDFIKSQGDPLESGLANLGMGTPAKRFVVGYAAGALLVWAVRPSISFDDQGKPKPWVFLTQDPGSYATSAPWWGLAAIPAVIFSVFL